MLKGKIKLSRNYILLWRKSTAPSNPFATPPRTPPFCREDTLQNVKIFKYSGLIQRIQDFFNSN